MAELLSIVALTRVYPEGQRSVAFALEYDCELDGDFDVTAFSVADHSLEPQVPPSERKILRAYSNHRPECGAGHVRGRYVVLETDPAQKESFAIMNYTHEGKPNPFGPGPMGYQRPGEKPPEPPKGPPRAPGGPDPKKMGYTGPKPLKVEVTQTVPLQSVDGQTVPPCAGVCKTMRCPEAERFRLGQYQDLPYTLYIPENYNPDSSYPLVLFIPDASGRCTDSRIPLLQGTGGVVWTSPEDQARHPCFVVCPAFGPDELLTHDDFTCLPKLYEVKQLLEHIGRHYSIDKDRIYTTGQSMGCMSSCELMCAYPDYFAGAILVAGQWDPERCGRAMYDQNLWILVSENDLKAHPGMDAVTQAIEANGGKVARSHWDARLDVEALNAAAVRALDVPANVHYTLFDGDTVVPPGQQPNPGANHTNTWRVAYQISAVRDWLFTNRRPAKKDRKNP